jgi:hypothetical protein
MKTDNNYTVFSVIKNENDREIEKILTENGYKEEYLVIFDSEFFNSSDETTYIYVNPERKVYSISKILTNKTSKQEKILHFYSLKELFLFTIGLKDKNYYVTKQPFGSVNYPESYIQTGSIVEFKDEETILDNVFRKATIEDVINYVKTWTKE